MRKVFLVMVLLMPLIQLVAQERINLKEYTGRYIFPEGSLTDDAVITVINDTTLNISASIGESELKYINPETFTLPQYGGTIVFMRDEADDIRGFKVTLPMAGIDNLEAQKETVHIFETHAHGGNRGGQPENTIIAMIDAMDIGTSTLEMDLQITKDKKVIVSHDAYFNEKITTTPDVEDFFPKTKLANDYYTRWTMIVSRNTM